ncbi:MAG: DUF3857 domain-containing protein [Bacteroidales bacterium]|nr:DUF3857 domain-containing protein [Bacteroidales bacterium]
MKQLIALFFTFFGFTIAAQESGADAIFQNITKEYTLKDDGSIEFHYYKKLKLLTHFSFNRLYGETFIVYNPDYQDLEINFCRTTHEDGYVTEAPFNAYNEVLPGFAADAPYFNGLREMVVTHPGTEINATLELDYTLTSKPGYFPAVMADEVLTETSPVQEEAIIVRIPSNKELHYKVFNIRTAPEISEEKGMKIYSFKFNGIPEISHERFQPARLEHLPRLIFSTITMVEAINFVNQQQAFDYKTDKQIQELIKKIHDENNNDLSFVLDLHKTFAQGLNTYEISPVYSGFKARPAVETWNGNGGTPFEKSLLLTAVMREAGIHAIPVIAVPTALYDEQIGCLSMMDHFYVQANPRELEQMYLPVKGVPEQNAVFNLGGYTLIGLGPQQDFKEHLSEKFENKVVTNGNLTFDDSLKYSGSFEVLLTEAANPYYQIEEDSNTVKGFLTGLSSQEIISSKVINSAQFRSLLDLKVQSTKPVKNQGNYYFFELPENKRGTESWHLNYLIASRVDPFDIPFPVDEEYSFEITLPKNIKLVNPVELIEIKTNFGELILSSVQLEDKVIVKRLLKLVENTIPIQDYGRFKEMIDLWNDTNKNKLILRINR